MIHRIRIPEPCDCAGCSVPLFPSEIGYADSETGLVGHSLDCLADALAELRDANELALYRDCFELNAIAGGAV